MEINWRMMQLYDRVHSIHIDDVICHSDFIYRLYFIDLTFGETMRDIFGNGVVFCVIANTVIYSTDECY